MGQWGHIGYKVTGDRSSAETGRERISHGEVTTGSMRDREEGI